MPQDCIGSFKPIICEKFVKILIKIYFICIPSMSDIMTSKPSQVDICHSELWQKLKGNQKNYVYYAT